MFLLVDIIYLNFENHVTINVENFKKIKKNECKYVGLYENAMNWLLIVVHVIW